LQHFCSHVASAASHPRWKVAGAFLGSGVEKEFTGSSIAPQPTLKGGGINLESTGCTTTGKIVGSAAGAPGTNTSVTLTCSGVKVIGTSATICTVHSPGQANGTVKTNFLSSTLVYLNETSDAVVGDLFKPTTGGEFVKIEITGEECSVAGNYAITGEIIGKFKQAPA
jgi:hypothetical protein